MSRVCLGLVRCLFILYTIALNSMRDRNTVKNDGGDQMLVAFIVTKINYLVVNLFFAICRGPFPIYICGVKFFGCAIYLVSSVATKAAMPSPDMIRHYAIKKGVIFHELKKRIVWKEQSKPICAN